MGVRTTFVKNASHWTRKRSHTVALSRLASRLTSICGLLNSCYFTHTLTVTVVLFDPVLSSGEDGSEGPS